LLTSVKQFDVIGFLEAACLSLLGDF